MGEEQGIFKSLLEGNQSVKLLSDAERGRYLVAKTSLRDGDTVMQCKSYERGVLGSHKKRVCAHCFKDNGQRLRVHCPDCSQCWYCDESCLEKHRAGQDHSSLQCQVLGSFGSAKFNGDMESIVRILLSVLAKANENGVNQPSSSSSSSKDNFKCSSSFDYFANLQSHADDLLPKSLKDLKKAALFLKKQLERCNTGAREVHYSLDDLVHHASRIESNCFGIFVEHSRRKGKDTKLADEERETTETGETGEEVPPEEKEEKISEAPEQVEAAVDGEKETHWEEERSTLIGREVYLEASMFNHSCEPNCEMSRSSGNCEIKCTRDVKEGEELTISYIDESQCRSHRRQALLRNYHFHCQCSKCDAESQTNKKKGGKAKNKAANKASKKKKNKAAINGKSTEKTSCDYDAQVAMQMQKLLQM